MTMTLFNDGWTVRGDSALDAVPITLPHDAMIGESRSRTAPSGAHGSYFPGGRYVYSKRWTPGADAAGRTLSLLFEGVYGTARVLVDGKEVASNISGYREFTAPLSTSLDPDEPLLIEVEVDNSQLPNSRWYTGTGIYRNVWLTDRLATHIHDDGLDVDTELRGNDAHVAVSVAVENPLDQALRATAMLTGPDGRTFAGESAVREGIATILLQVNDAELWSDVSPDLHDLAVTLHADGQAIDHRTAKIGLRTLDVDATNGLRINGRPVKLRGACVHHDNGILGAATFRSAEYRRAHILKEAGFNAIRSSHNPLSRNLLDACDELGLYVIDELTDLWFGSKTAHDLAPSFDDIWRDDAQSMVAKDRLHPSVIMYSIGNEIAESNSQRGVTAAQQINDFILELDPSRPTTIAVNFLLNFVAASGRSLFNTAEHDPDKVERKPSAATSTMANVIANRIGGLMQLVSKLPKSDTVTREPFSKVHVAGYNYAWARYAGDAKRHSDRVVVGSESMPGHISKIWPLVERFPNVIGDFVWTGWDYLGEAGLGTWSYGPASASIGKAYPELVAGCGLIDIIGHPGAGMLLTQAAWRQLPAPQIAVRPLDHAGEKVNKVAWRSTDAIRSWAWAGADGKTADIEVYSSDHEVEVLINGRSLGRKAGGRRRGYVTRYRTRYEPGEIVAVSYRNGVETSRSRLTSSHRPTVRLTEESAPPHADHGDLVFIKIEIADAEGTVEMLEDDAITIEITGPGTLAGLGSAAPRTEESFIDARHTTHYGRALAAIRPTGAPGSIELKVTSERHGDAKLILLPAPLGVSSA